MKNSKNVLLIALAALTLLTGCDEPTQQSASNVNTYLANTSVQVYCDKDENVEYFIYNEYRAGGMTLRVNSDGTPKTCSNK